MDGAPLLLFLGVTALVGGLVGLALPRSMSPLRRVVIAAATALLPFLLAYLFVVTWFLVGP